MGLTVWISAKILLSFLFIFPINNLLQLFSVQVKCKVNDIEDIKWRKWRRTFVAIQSYSTKNSDGGRNTIEKYFILGKKEKSNGPLVGKGDAFPAI